MWAQAINVVIGLWIMVAPGIFNWSPSAATSGHIVGPVIVTFSFTALWEVTRGVRKANYPLAIWLLAAPWVLDYSVGLATINSMVSGVLVIIFSSVKGEITQHFGGGWSSLWKDKPEHLKEANRR